MARYLSRRYKGTYVPEYAREYVEEKGSTDVSYDELCAIARKQIEEMKEVQRDKGPSTKVIFFDTELIVTKVWFDYAFHRVPEWLDEAVKAYPMDVYLLTKPDIPWVPDPARSNGTDEIRQELFHRYEAEIQALDIPYYIITHG
ncbi:MAG: ATP-binding protein [Paludibacteraceae bacterium]|nr:ATP-binding protein [Paludibacteraceae bacterium]